MFQVPSLVYKGRIYEGAAAFKWLEGVRGTAVSEDQPGASSQDPPFSDGCVAASVCSMYSGPSSSLQFADCQEPTEMKFQTGYTEF